MSYPEAHFKPLVVDTYQMYCLTTFYDITVWIPGRISVWRRDKSGYYACVQDENVTARTSIRAVVK